MRAKTVINKAYEWTNKQINNYAYTNENVYIILLFYIYMFLKCIIDKKFLLDKDIGI